MFAYTYNNPVNYSDPSGYHAVIEDAIAYGGGGGGIGLWAWILGLVSNPVAQEAGVLYAQQGHQITEGAKNTGEKLKELAGGNGGGGSNPDPNKFNNGKGKIINQISKSDLINNYVKIEDKLKFLKDPNGNYQKIANRFGYDKFNIGDRRKGI